MSCRKERHRPIDRTKVVKVERNTKKVSFLSLQYFIQRQAHRKGKMFTTQSNYYI